jgi:hypothetical protein
MSLAIETDTVAGVLLADGWHPVKEKTFDLDAYEFVHGETLIHGGGKGGVCAAGFTFVESSSDMVLAGPLTAILAVRYRQVKQ